MVPPLLPGYSQLRERPARLLPQALKERENNPQSRELTDALQRRLSEPPGRPKDDAQLFVSLAKHAANAITLKVPHGGSALLVFSSAIRAADYIDVQLNSDRTIGFRASTAVELFSFITATRNSGVAQIALDRCPRCEIFTATSIDSIRSADRLVGLWALAKSLQQGRLILYLEFALEAARSGDLRTAKEIGLEIVGHVAVEDPQPHWLLGQIAIGLGDLQLLHEAQAFLRLLRHGAWADELSHLSESKITEAPFSFVKLPAARTQAAIAPEASSRRADEVPTVPFVEESTRPEPDPDAPRRRIREAAADRRASFSVGDLIEGALRVKRVHRGGMGVVYIVELEDESRASRNIDIVRGLQGAGAGDLAGRALKRRWFAVKMLLSGGLDDMTDILRFERECLVWSTLLPHPNVVRAYTAARVEEITPFVLLEYVGGGTLRERVRVRVGVPDALALAMQVCAGMRFLQDSAGIVHRDLKPENILLTTDGIAKVTDFGLVQTGLPTMLRSAEESSGGVVDIALTTDGVIAGSIPYMAPEQFLGARADVRSDVYAFGVVLYELLSGRRPFHAADFAGYRRCHLEEPPAPLTELEDVSSDVGEIVMTCLAKNPEDRFQDFGALSRRIGDVLRRRGLESLIPPTISPEVLESRMTAIDWEGRGRSLLTIGETSAARQGREDARPFLERAHHAYQRAIGLPGHTVSIHGATGTVLWLLDRHDEAVAHFHKQLRVDRSDRRAHVGLARNLVRLGQVDDALRLLDNARAALGDDGSFENELLNIRASRQGGAAVFDVWPSSGSAAAESRPSLRQRVTSWFGRRRHKDAEVKALLRSVRLELAGWQEEIEQPACRVWRDAQNNILTLTVVTDNLAGLPTGDVVEVRRWARAIAENAGAGLIEARAISGVAGNGAALIYKSRRDFGFLFTGMLFWFGQISGVWTMMSRDNDLHAGNREATVSAELLSSSQLTKQEYERSWAQDPYDPTYTGVARDVLRCLSDSEQYDVRFPDHPLSQIRNVLNQLPPVNRAS